GKRVTAKSSRDRFAGTVLSRYQGSAGCGGVACREKRSDPGLWQCISGRRSEPSRDPVQTSLTWSEKSQAAEPVIQRGHMHTLDDLIFSQQFPDFLQAE